MSRDTRGPLSFLKYPLKLEAMDSTLGIKCLQSSQSVAAQHPSAVSQSAGRQPGAARCFPTLFLFFSARQRLVQHPSWQGSGPCHPSSSSSTSDETIFLTVCNDQDLASSLCKSFSSAQSIGWAKLLQCITFFSVKIWDSNNSYLLRWCAFHHLKCK